MKEKIRRKEESERLLAIRDKNVERLRKEREAFDREVKAEKKALLEQAKKATPKDLKTIKRKFEKLEAYEISLLKREDAAGEAVQTAKDREAFARTSDKTLRKDVEEKKKILKGTDVLTKKESDLSDEERAARKEIESVERERSARSKAKERNIAGEVDAIVAKDRTADRPVETYLHKTSLMDERITEKEEEYAKAKKRREKKGRTRQSTIEIDTEDELGRLKSKRVVLEATKPAALIQTPRELSELEQEKMTKAGSFRRKEKGEQVITAEHLALYPDLVKEGKKVGDILEVESERVYVPTEKGKGTKNIASFTRDTDLDRIRGTRQFAKSDLAREVEEVYAVQKDHIEAAEAYYKQGGFARFVEGKKLFGIKLREKSEETERYLETKKAYESAKDGIIMNLRDKYRDKVKSEKELDSIVARYIDKALSVEAIKRESDKVNEAKIKAFEYRKSEAEKNKFRQAFATVKRFAWDERSKAAKFAITRGFFGFTGSLLSGGTVPIGIIIARGLASGYVGKRTAKFAERKMKDWQLLQGENVKRRIRKLEKLYGTGSLTIGEYERQLAKYGLDMKTVAMIRKGITIGAAVGAGYGTGLAVTHGVAAAESGHLFTKQTVENMGKGIRELGNKVASPFVHEGAVEEATKTTTVFPSGTYTNPVEKFFPHQSVDSNFDYFPGDHAVGADSVPGSNDHGLFGGDQAVHQTLDTNLKPTTLSIDDIRGTTDAAHVFDVPVGDGKGAISMFGSLQEKLHAQYPNFDPKTAPSGVFKDLMTMDKHTLAEKYNFYNPADGSESALIEKGAHLVYNEETGKLLYARPHGTNILLEDGDAATPSGEFTGTFLDSDHTGGAHAPIEHHTGDATHTTGDTHATPHHEASDTEWKHSPMQKETTGDTSAAQTADTTPAKETEGTSETAGTTDGQNNEAQEYHSTPEEMAETSADIARATKAWTGSLSGEGIKIFQTTYRDQVANIFHLPDINGRIGFDSENWDMMKGKSVSVFLNWYQGQEALGNAIPEQQQALYSFFTLPDMENLDYIGIDAPETVTIEDAIARTVIDLSDLASKYPKFRVE